MEWKIIDRKNGKTLWKCLEPGRDCWAITRGDGDIAVADEYDDLDKAKAELEAEKD